MILKHNTKVVSARPIFQTTYEISITFGIRIHIKSIEVNLLILIYIFNPKWTTLL
jgi:hypothetical protein